MFSLVDDYHVNFVWKPLAGWNGRSAPERAKVKIPLTRQDVARWGETHEYSLPFLRPLPPTRLRQVSDRCWPRKKAACGNMSHG